MKEKSESKRMVPFEELNKQRREYLDEIRQVTDELNLKKQDVEELNKRVSQILDENEKLKVLYAAYGKPEDMKDVTQDIKKGVKSDGLHFTVNNNAFTISDPAPGIKKQFLLVFQKGGIVENTLVQEGEVVHIDPFKNS